MPQNKYDPPRKAARWRPSRGPILRYSMVCATFQPLQFAFRVRVSAHAGGAAAAIDLPWRRRRVMQHTPKNSILTHLKVPVIYSTVQSHTGHVGLLGRWTRCYARSKHLAQRFCSAGPCALQVDAVVRQSNLHRFHITSGG